MCKGGSNTTTQTQNQSYTPSPAVSGAGTQAINMAQNAASQPFQLPTAPVAGFTPFQEQAFNQTQGAQGMAQPYFDIASQYASASAAPTSAGQVANYLNPYANYVLGNLSETQGTQMRDLTGQATGAAGGVGADRVAVAQAELARQQGLARGQTLANIYQPALGAAQQEQQRQANAAYTYGMLGPAAQNTYLSGTNALMGAGGMQQQLQQAQMNAPYQNQLAKLAYPFQTAQYLANITGGLGPAMGGSKTTAIFWRDIAPSGRDKRALQAGFGRAHSSALAVAAVAYRQRPKGSVPLK